MTPPDETLLAALATVVSFVLVMPLILKWWPRAKRKRPPGKVPAANRPLATKQPTATAAARTQTGRGTSPGQAGARKTPPGADRARPGATGRTASQPPRRRS